MWQEGMEEASENGKESSHSAHANGIGIVERNLQVKLNNHSCPDISGLIFF
jgi:hypothetical protein